MLSQDNSVQSARESKRNEWREPILRAEVNSWLKKHGLRERPKQLSQTQKRDLREIFRMMDDDGSGALDSDEIIQAFKLINMPTSKAKIMALMGDVLLGDTEAELDYEAFELLMTRRMNDTMEDAAQDTMSVMPFHEIANAFRRKKTLEAFMNGGTERQKIIDSENSKQKKITNIKRWRMPQMKARMARAFRTDRLHYDHSSSDRKKDGSKTFEDGLSALKGEIAAMQGEAESSTRVLDIFANTDSSNLNSPSSSAAKYSSTKSFLRSRSITNTPQFGSAFRPNTCPSYFESKSMNTGKTSIPLPDYLPPLTPAPRKLEQEFEDIQTREELDMIFDSLKKEDVTKMRPSTSAAVNASETRYSAYWRAARKDFFDADIVQAKAQIVMAKVKPPKAEVNPWANMDEEVNYKKYLQPSKAKRKARDYSFKPSSESAPATTQIFVP